MPPKSTKKGQLAIPASLAIAFDDLISRFLLSVPSEELESQERLFVQLQESHWFYTDFYSDRQSHLPKLGFRDFSLRFLEHQPLVSLRAYANPARFDEFFARFREYILSVPVCGCIILSSDMKQVVLVKSFKGNSWSFPKGKMDRGETQIDCAAREVHEECGFDCTRLLTENDYIEIKDATTQHLVRLYIAAGVDASTAVFKTLTRKEIGAIEWFPIRSLPGGTHRDVKDNGNGGKEKKSFWLVKPFIHQLKKWIKAKREGKSNPSTVLAHNKARTTSVAPSSGSDSGSDSTSSSSINSRSGQKKKNKKGDRRKENKAPKSEIKVKTSPSSSPSSAPTVPIGKAPVQLFTAPISGGVLEGGGWSPEEMFATNAKLGVQSVEVDEPLVYPPNADEIFAKFLGPNHPHLRTPRSASAATTNGNGNGKQSRSKSNGGVVSDTRRISPSRTLPDQWLTPPPIAAGAAPVHAPVASWSTIPRPPPLVDLDQTASTSTSVTRLPTPSPVNDKNRFGARSPPLPPLPSPTSRSLQPTYTPLAGPVAPIAIAPVTSSSSSASTAGVTPSGVALTISVSSWTSSASNSTTSHSLSASSSSMSTSSTSLSSAIAPRPSLPVAGVSLVAPAPSPSPLITTNTPLNLNIPSRAPSRAPSSSPPASMLNFKFDSASIMDALLTSPVMKPSPPTINNPPLSVTV